MKNQRSLLYVSTIFLLSCTVLPVLTPVATPTAFIPTITPPPTIAITDVLTQQVTNDLRAFLRPACEPGKRNDSEWQTYDQGLASALKRLFSEPRAQSLSSQSLATIFQQASGLELGMSESNADAALVTIVKANCPQKIGGGTSPDSPRDSVYVVNRHGGIWQIVQVANMAQAVWAENRWNALVTRTQWGNAQDFEVWHISASTGEWKGEAKLKFTQLYGDPLPHLNADGTSVTLYSLPAACNAPKNLSAPYPTIESEYKWQNGQYQCAASRVIPTPTATPTRRP